MSCMLRSWSEDLQKSVKSVCLCCYSAFLHRFDKSDGYDSGIGSSPLNSELPQPPPQTLALNVNIKPKHRRRKRGSSTTVQGFDDAFERTGRILGAGAFAQVEVCCEKKTLKEYAVKIIQKENWYTRTRVLQEVEILERGKGHPNIIQLEQYFEGDSQFYLVFEMMRGGSLINHIESHVRFTEREAATVVKCVTSALEHLHGQGIAHRDLKFENILCGDNFTDVKICDFDLGGQKLDLPYLSTPLMDSPVGSAEFMAPEVVSLFEGHRSFYDKSCDMWSLGVLIYIMVYGKPPFTGRCGLNCGWETGEECKQCQDSLFRNITNSKVHFDDNINVSFSVRDLISSLLQKDARERLTTTEVLSHPWVQTGGNDNLLYTPQQLKRNKSSALNLQAFSNQANEHVRRINSKQSLHNSPQSAEQMDPLDKAFGELEMGESWYEEDLDNGGEEDELFFSFTTESHQDHAHAHAHSPISYHGSHHIIEPSPPMTPTDFYDNTPVQTSFVFPPKDTNCTPDQKVDFYISSDDDDE